MRTNTILTILLFSLFVNSSVAMAERDSSRRTATLYSTNNYVELNSLAQLSQGFNTPTDLNYDGPNVAEFSCQTTSIGSWCRCQGENSSDCDNLFVACDEIGGLFSCGSDYGLGLDACDCEF